MAIINNRRAKTVNVLSIIFAEFLGTFILLFLTCSGGIVWTQSNLPPAFFNAFNSGLVIMVVIHCFADSSGAIVNPAVTFSALIYGKLSFPMSLVYFVSQMAGGIAGYRLMWFLTPDEVRQLAGPTGICMTLPGHGVSTEQAMICEFVATTILVLLNCVAWDPRNAGRQDSMALKLGLAVACLSVALGPYSGCSMNPIRSFGPAFWNQSWEHHWIYWTMPFGAAGITTLVYKSLWKSD